jgi:GH25 family lysozyme M1 (1,4-beta-N-acetylmuramidase)
MTDVVLGGDVANYQGRVDWPRVAAAGWRYAWVLATDGSAFFDTYEPDDVAGARAAGIKPGGYHFARPAKHSPLVEASWYRAHVGDELELPTALDMEADWLPGTSANTDWALRFFDAIAPSVRVLYTNGDGATRHLDTQRLVDAGVELWYAHPGAADFAGIGAWPTAAAVQYGTGPVDGIAGVVDLDAMRVDVFARWLPQPAPAPPLHHPTDQEEETMQVVVTPDGVIHVFVTGTDFAVWTTELAPGGQWTAWASLGGIEGEPKPAPAA